MTLMPVTRIAASVDWSTKGGASAWIGADMSLPIGPRSSIGSPMTFMIRPSVLGPTGTRICEPVALTVLAAGEAVGRVHGDGADDILAEVLGDLEHQAVAAVVGLERRQDRRQLAFERDVDDGADDLADAAGEVARSGVAAPAAVGGGGLLGAGLGLGVGGGGHVCLPCLQFR